MSTAKTFAAVIAALIAVSAFPLSSLAQQAKPQAQQRTRQQENPQQVLQLREWIQQQQAIPLQKQISQQAIEQSLQDLEIARTNQQIWQLRQQQSDFRLEQQIQQSRSDFQQQLQMDRLFMQQVQQQSLTNRLF